MEQEIWADLLGFENNYSISSFGRVKRKESSFVRADGVIRFFKERLLGGNFNKGYLFVAIQKVGESKKYPVHRMVAQNFIPNPLNLPQVNHKNGVKSDNRVSNLEWCTNYDNSKHSREVLGKDTGIKNRVPIICVTTGVEYASVIEAARAFKISPSNINNVLRGTNKHTGGYKFKYKQNALN